ncbi:MAG: methylmalonyl-CoA mutase family protein [Chloroflexota bacterium]
MTQKSYQPKNHIRIVTAASLFDGHDATINVMRRILQSSGAEVIHLGHDRSVQQVVMTAIQEDAQAIAITSYQGGHLEYMKYAYDLLAEHGCDHIKIFGGGGGTILPHEQQELHDYGIARIYSPDDGRAMGLQGMINDLLEKADFPTGHLGDDWQARLDEAMGDSSAPVPAAEGVAVAAPPKVGINNRALGQLISALENDTAEADKIRDALSQQAPNPIPVLGITGTGGAGKSSLTDELVRRFLHAFEDKQIAILSVDPSKRRTGGALLGDRIRMNSIYDARVYMRSLATRETNLSVSRHIPEVINLLKSAAFDLVILETSGIGQSGTEVVDLSDVSLYVMTPEFGAASQLEKIDMLDFADVVAINKFDKRGAPDAIRDVKKQIKRNRGLWDATDDSLPVYGTIASQFNDPGTHQLFAGLMQIVSEKTDSDFKFDLEGMEGTSEKIYIIPPKRVRYLSEISDTIRNYNDEAEQQAVVANDLQAIVSVTEQLAATGHTSDELASLKANLQAKLNAENQEILELWDAKKANYTGDEYVYQVRGRDIRVNTKHETLSHNFVSKVSLPRYTAWGDILKWSLQENVPGEFPYTAGVFPFKRQGEDPTRMFAGEGGPERTNRRFHYVSLGMPAKRLSTAFDSVTLYGNDPAYRPDIYGKVGNSGVSIPSLDAAKKLYSGFDLCDKATSVSMTINGPAATVLAFFLNAAIDQQCERYIYDHEMEEQVEQKLRHLYEDRGLQRPSYQGELPEGNDGLGLLLLGITGDQILPPDVYARIKADTLTKVRGTVQADILKEDQAQNTCIFSTEFSLRLMGDIQQYFIDYTVNNFYSVSISGYHMAEAGANPISQLAFTLANGFTFLEYYRARGMDVDKFAPNFSFFFSNGIDPEYAVIGRVARRIWAKALKLNYNAGERAQKLKYHIQTSGRSLHAQEIGFNDIRTTLQALYAIYDNCNSLHTNAYDEAITTPTEESVRRAMAIQLIINRELGLAKNENPLPGAFIIDELTDLVEEAVLMEFDRLTDRGGVLGAMETMYQRSKIQEESLYYETLKHNGSYPIIGVNTFLSDEGSPTSIPNEVIRSTESEKTFQIQQIEQLTTHHPETTQATLQALQRAAVNNENTFDALMEAVKYCSLGQITTALFDVGGQYRRNM